MFKEKHINGIGYWSNCIPDIRSNFFSDVSLKKSTVKLKSYSGEDILVIGQIEVLVKYNHQEENLTLLVVKEMTIAYLEEIGSLKTVLDHHSAVFQEELGKLKDYKVKITVDPQTTPRFCKARPVPHALKTKVEEELDRLTAEGITEPKQFAYWAAPIVAVLKEDQTVSIYGDLKQTIKAG